MKICTVPAPENYVPDTATLTVKSSELRCYVNAEEGAVLRSLTWLKDNSDMPPPDRSE